MTDDRMNEFEIAEFWKQRVDRELRAARLDEDTHSALSGGTIGVLPQTDPAQRRRKPEMNATKTRFGANPESVWPLRPDGPVTVAKPSNLPSHFTRQTEFVGRYVDPLQSSSRFGSNRPALSDELESMTEALSQVHGDPIPQFQKTGAAYRDALAASLRNRPKGGHRC